MALKDWKKKTYSDGSFSYINKKRNGTLHIGARSVSIRIGTVKHQGINLPEAHIHEEFKSKSQALKFAKCFMKTENWENCVRRK